MGKKFLSLIVIPHTKSRSRTLSFSKRMIKAMVWAAIIGGVLLALVTVDYVRIRLSSQSYRLFSKRPPAERDAQAI